MGVRWTPYLDRCLKQHADLGLSGSQVAVLMNTTRNAVLGRAHRIGVAFDSSWDHHNAATKAAIARPQVAPANPDAAEADRVQENIRRARAV